MSASSPNSLNEALDQAKVTATISVKGNAERFAGETYNETTHIAHYHLASPNEVGIPVTAGIPDQLALAEAIFIQRFKFDAPKCVRDQIYRLKQERDVTDLEIKILKRTGALVIKDHQVWVNEGRWMLWVGLFLFALVVLYCAFWATVFQYSQLTLFQKMMAEGYYAVLFCALCWGIKRNLLSPYRIVKRIGTWA